MIATRFIPIVGALMYRSNIEPFIPYMLDTNLQVEKKFPGLENLQISEYDINAFENDNKIVMSWFTRLQERFNQWLCQRDLKPVMLEATGSRSFGVSYTESDLDCAIISKNFNDFLNFCHFLNTNYNRHNFIAKKTIDGLPLLIIKADNGFCCPELSACYPNKTLPQLEVTFRHPRVHKLIQDSGQCFFSALTDIEVQSYIYNKRYIELMRHNLPNASHVGGKPLKIVLDEFKDALAYALKYLPHGHLQDTPDFNKDVFASSITTRSVLSNAIVSGITVYRQSSNKLDQTENGSGLTCFDHFS